MSKLGRFCTIIMCFLLLSVRVKAAPEVMADGNVFDADYYAQNNPDVVAELGADPVLLYQHYLLCGMAEGRHPFDDTAVSGYRQSLAQKTIDCFKSTYSYYYGALMEDAVVYTSETGRHLMDVGTCRSWTIRSELSLTTDESYFFDYVRYAADYPEVVAAVGTGKQALWQHFKTTGVYQGYRAYATTTHINAKLFCIYTLPDIVSGAYTQRDQIRAVHDWIITHSKFAVNYFDMPITQEMHTMEGLIFNGVAVCDGYAYTFDWFMYLLGIKCDFVNSNGHAWNCVQIDGQYLALDLSWDDDDDLVYYCNGVVVSDGSGISTNWFLLTEEQMCGSGSDSTHMPVEHKALYE